MTDNCFCPGHDIVASFKLKMPISLLQDNILQLQEDIFNEMAYTGIKVLAVMFFFFFFGCVTYFIFLRILI